MAAQYLSMPLLVDAMAAAVASANPSLGGPECNDEAIAAAATRCESLLREAAAAGEIHGHDFDSLAPKDSRLLNLERDVFHVDQLNSCFKLTSEDFEFVVQKDEREERAFVAAFAETVINDRPISWQYWVEQMPALNTAQASRLLTGLDPDVFADLSARPNRNDPSGQCARAMAIERLATAKRFDVGMPTAWLEWATTHGLRVHDGFRLAVEALPAAMVADEVIPPGKGTPKKWTGERLEELRAFRDQHGTKKAAHHFGVTGARVRQLLPTGKSAPKGHSVFTHRPK